LEQPKADNMVYSNDHYFVRLVPEDERTTYEGQWLNWELVSKEHGVAEGTFAALPLAVQVADQFSQMILMDTAQQPLDLQ